MSKRRQKDRCIAAYSARVRAVAFVCLLLAAVIGTVQAVHIHGDWLPDSRAQFHAPSQSSEPGGEEHCPLCVAMHATLPVALHVDPGTALLLDVRVVESERSAKETSWHFPLFSRPPPRLA